MNLLRTISLLFILSSFASCISEDMSNCKECEGVVLNFEYPNFPNKINKVNIGIFDKDGILVESRQINKNDLTVFQGLKLGLEAGNYSAICWGNAFENTKIKGLNVSSKMKEMEVSHPNSGTSDIIQTNDSLFYGKHVFTIPSDRKYTGTVIFKPAHIRFKIGVKGLDVQKYTVAININHLKTIYNYEMQTSGEMRSYSPAMKTFPAENLWKANSDVLRFNYENPITVDLLDLTGNKILATVDVQSFVRDNNISLAENKEVIIPILFNFSSGDISVEPKIEMWEEGIVIPEW